MLPQSLLEVGLLSMCSVAPDRVDEDRSLSLGCLLAVEESLLEHGLFFPRFPKIERGLDIRLHFVHGQDLHLLDEFHPAILVNENEKF
jgi:hypothetical protein